MDLIFNMTHYRWPLETPNFHSNLSPHTWAFIPKLISGISYSFA